MYYNQYITTKTASELSPAPGTSDFRVYYYSDTLKGTTAATVQSGVMYTTFDMVLAKLGITQTSNGYYSFEGYKYGDNIYVRVDGDCYVGLGSSKTDRMYFTSNTLIPNPTVSNVFTSTGMTHESFGVTKYKFDALLYSLTGSSAQVTYDVYEAGSNKYIKVNNNFVRIDDSLLGSGKELGSISQTTQVVEYLFNKFYQPSVTETAPIINTRYSGNMSITTTWHTGIQIILKYYNITADSSNTELVITNTGENYLQVNGATATVYINLAGLAEASYHHNGTQYDINILSTDSEQVKWRIYNAKSDYSGEVTAIYLQNDSALVNSTTTKLVGDLSATYNVDGAPNTLKTHDVTAYTYLNLLSSYFNFILSL